MSGRLDKDSEGLLLMTNHGDIINKMMRAANYHEKEYEVTVDKEFNDRFLKDMAAGVHLKELDVTTRPCQVERLGKKKFKIILTQGLNRQIRRMCKELGFHVTGIKRVRIMNIHLGHLTTGGYRNVTEAETSGTAVSYWRTHPMNAGSMSRNLMRRICRMTNKEQQIARMKELGELLRNASKAYYAEDREIMSNLEYDKLYDELAALEKETGTVLSGSPTMTVGYEAVDELPKERHASPMLSLDKTKDVGELAAFAGDHEVLLSWKLDGLTVVLTYENGQLSKAVTRGNGEVGEVITNNARVFKNVPLTIPCKEQVILRGEAVIRYSDFERINEEIEDEAAKYKNPRNLCSGSVRQLNNEITAKRNVYFYAFALVQAEGVEFDNSREKQFLWLKEPGL